MRRGKTEKSLLTDERIKCKQPIFGTEESGVHFIIRAAMQEREPGASKTLNCFRKSQADSRHCISSCSSNRSLPSALSSYFDQEVLPSVQPVESLLPS